MKRLLLITFCFSFLVSIQLSGQCGNLYIGGVIDGPLAGGTPKGIQFCASADIADLSIYGFGSANNGGGSDGQEFTFPDEAISAGDCFWVGSGTANWMTWFGFEPCYTSSAASINGDDALELFCSGTVEDLFGDIDVDGNGECWEYLDGWAVNNTGGSNGGTFNCADWDFSGANALDNEDDNATATDPYPTPDQVCPAPAVPVTLVSFSALSRDKEVQLSWATASEINNHYFEIQHSLDGINFGPIGTVEGNGNSSNLIDYAFVDNSPALASNYYRLKQLDFDGAFEYSKVISVRLNNKLYDIALTPSPVKEELFLSVTNDISLEIFSLSGVRVISVSNILGGSVDVSDLQSGIYLVRIQSQNEIITKKIIKQ